MVKSVIVPVANLLSNLYLLAGRGVPIRTILHGTASKVTEINTYIKSRMQEIDLEAELRAAQGRNDVVEIRKLETRIQTIQDGYRRLSEVVPDFETGA